MTTADDLPDTPARDHLSVAEIRLLRALLPARGLLEDLEAHPGTPMTCVLSAQTPRSHMARAGEQVGNRFADTTSWYLHREAQQADLRAQSDLRRITAALVRGGGRVVPVARHARSEEPVLTVRMTPRQLAAARRTLGPALHRVLSVDVDRSPRPPAE